MKGIQDENYIPDSHMNIVVGRGGLLAGAPHALLLLLAFLFFSPCSTCLFLMEVPRLMLFLVS